MNLNELRDRAYKTACEHGWHEENLSNEHNLCLVISELMEAVEADRKRLCHYVQKFSNPKVELEVWKPVVGYEDDYEVSNLGRVRSKDMMVWNGITYHRKKGKILKPGLGGSGYYTVSLRGKTHKVARLVASAFLIKESDRDYVNHIDGDKTNDNIANLEYVSPSSNNKHASITGLHKYKSKLSYEQKVEIAFLHKLGIAYTTIHKNNSYGVTKSAIQRICNDYQKYTDSVEFELTDAIIRIFDYFGTFNITIDDCCLEDEVIEEYSRIYKDKTFTESVFNIVASVTRFEIQVAFLKIFGLANYLGIDLMWHIEQKMKYNELRPYKHGNKKY